TKTPERSLSSSTADHTAGVTGKGRRCYRGQTRTRRPNRSARPVRRWGLVLNMAPTAGLGHVGALYYTPDASEVSCTNTGGLSAVKPRRIPLTAANGPRGESTHRKCLGERGKSP